MRRDHLVYAGVGAVVLTVLSFTLLGFGRLLLGWRGALWIAAIPATIAIGLGLAVFVRSVAHLSGVWPLADAPDPDSDLDHGTADQGPDRGPDDDLW